MLSTKINALLLNHPCKITLCVSPRFVYGGIFSFLRRFVSNFKFSPKFDIYWIYPLMRIYKWKVVNVYIYIFINVKYMNFANFRARGFCESCVGRGVMFDFVISHSQHHLPFFFSFRGAIVFSWYYALLKL